MRFLTVADQELRVAARRKTTHRLRWLTGAGFIAFLAWLAWAFDLFTRTGKAPDVFRLCSVMAFVYCLLVGAAATADCISRERREGTLGLLFLTNLNSLEIVTGKLFANALAVVYSLLAVLPIMAILLLVGGITFEIFYRTALALVGTLFLSIAAGFFASAFCERQFQAVSTATLIAILFGTGPIALAEFLRREGVSTSTCDTISAMCPLHTVLAADNGTRFRSPGLYWQSLAIITGISFTWLLLVSWRLKYIWRDRPKSKRVRRIFGIKLFSGRRLNTTTPAVRRRLLDINPLYWLAGRQGISAPGFMLLTIVIVAITEWLAVPYFQWMFRNEGPNALVLGRMFTWAWTGLLIHAFVLYYAATVASQQLAEDRQNGGLELILSTPATERTISRGLWLAFARKMFFPVLAAVLAHFFFLWQCAVALIMDPPTGLGSDGNDFTRGMTPARLIWVGLFDLPVNGFQLEWPIVMILRATLLALVALAANWFALCWVGRWLGLKMKHPGFAPMISVALAIIPPTLLFTLVLYLGDKWHFDRLPGRQMAPLMMWITFGIIIGNCLILAWWAGGHLRRDLRTTVTNRFGAVLRPWWRSSLRLMLRAAGAAVFMVLLLALIVAACYIHQNWRSSRNWARFQTLLKQRGESLDLAAMLPAPVPDSQNFARNEAFRAFVDIKYTNQVVGPIRLALQSRTAALQLVSSLGYGPANTTGWLGQSFNDFQEELTWFQSSYRKGTIKNRNQAATNVLNALRPAETNMSAISAAAAGLPYFQPTTNRHSPAVNQYSTPELTAMEQLHFIFTLQANASLALDRPQDAGSNLLTSFHLAQLLRQSPDVLGSQRVQILLTRSFQPLWEGLVGHQWTESQLAEFQQELLKFNLLSDYTNAVHRVVLASIETWSAMEQNQKAPPRRPDVPLASWQPVSLWFEYSMSIYRAGRQATAQVDVAAGRVGNLNNWIDLEGVPLSAGSQELFQQQSWRGASPVLASFSQNALNQAVLACALERFRLAQGRYPATLHELLPTYLDHIPVDVITGRSMTYRPTADNNYVLRGAGPDGLVDPDKSTASKSTPASSDDWVWQSFVKTNAPPKAIPTTPRPAPVPR